jgi:hypothetical protein
MNSEHLIILDVFSFPLRNCRIYQEKIADFYESGKSRYEWEKIRQSYILTQNQAIINICAPCPLNLLQQAEGCRYKIQGLTTILAIINQIKPDSLFLNYDYYNTRLDRDDTLALADELKNLKINLNNQPWSAAEVKELANPFLPVTDENKPLAIYPWDGIPEGNWFAQKDYSLLGIAAEGLLLKDTRDDDPPLVLSRIFKEGESLYGENLEGKFIPLSHSAYSFPVFEDYSQEIEIKHAKISLAQAFEELLNTLETFLETAVKSRIGIEINSL